MTAVFFTCTLFSITLGRADEAGAALMEGAQEAVNFTISVSGGICLWSAVTELMEASGISGAISKGMQKLLRRFFPASSEDKNILAALSENISANLLGLGNAATPAGIRAAKGMKTLESEAGADELGMLVVLNTASIQLIPAGIAALRAAAGAEAAFDIVPAVWISSAFSLCAGLGSAALFRKITA